MTKTRVALLGILGIGITVVLYIWFGPYAIEITTDSMRPALHSGDRVLVNSVVGPVERGDIVLISDPLYPSQKYLKRVVGLAGEVVRLEGTQVVVDGKSLAERAVLVALGPTIDTVREVRTEGGGPYAVYYFEVRASDTSPEGWAAPLNGVHSPFTVPANSVFVLGDNRDNSEDSRHFGAIPLNNVVGRLMFVYSCGH